MFFYAYIFVCTCLSISYAEAICEKDGQVFGLGETYKPLGECVQYTCAEGGAFTALPCGYFQVDTSAGWTKSPEDLSKPYPDCCPQAVPPPTSNEGSELLPCVVEGRTVQVGDQFNLPGFCGLNVCKGNNQWSKAPCGLIGVPEGWTSTPEDPSKPYPECCAKAVSPL